MYKESLAQLIAISRAVGANLDYVQAGGCNTSVKSLEGRTTAIKASGTPLTAMSETAGWVELDTAGVFSIFDLSDLATLESSIREARALQHLSSAVIGGAGRPSVESALRAMLGRVVIHTHPVAADALNCGPGLRALKEITPTGELPPLWVPYTDPGWRLANTIKAAAEGYEKEHHRRPDVIFMDNHGLLVSAPEAQACVALHNQWVARCERYFAAQAPPLGAPAGLDSSALRKARSLYLARGARERTPIRTPAMCGSAGLKGGSPMKRQAQRHKWAGVSTPACLKPP